MILLAKNLSILCFFVVFVSIAECQVTVTNINGTGNFLCGYSTLLKCDIPGYGGGMSWKLDGTIIAQCAFSSCTALSALPPGDNFTYDEYHRKFYLEIGITHADNGTTYQCDDGLIQDLTTVNIAVPPSNMTVSVTDTDLTVEAGCFYPSNAGRMDVYCVNGSTEIKVGDTLSMIPTTTGCSGDCAGPNIYTATRSILIDNSTGNSAYRIKVYLDGFESYAITEDTPAIYNCDDYNISSNSVQVRLVDGDAYYRGRVEVYYQGQWGTICDDVFDHNDAKVICRMLGLYRGSSYGVAYESASFCEGDGPIMLDGLQCIGNEHDISQCGSYGWFSHNCSHYEDAGVDCYGYNHGNKITRQCNHQTTNDYNYHTTASPVQVRLVGGSYYHGRVEVYYQGQWGTICDDGFDHNDVKVICRMLGQYAGSNYGVAYSGAYYGEGTGPIVIDDLNCYGYESDISQCPSRTWLTSNCGHKEDVGVNCFEYFQDSTTADVRPSWYYERTSSPGYPYWLHATSSSQVQVRLVNGSYYYGRVEVYYHGQWGTICDDEFDHNDVKVICRMLGQYWGSDYGVAYQSASYGSGGGPIIIDELGCYGDESDITQCTSNPWYTHDCSHSEDASLNCHEYHPESSTADVRPSWYHERTTGYPYWLHATSSSKVQVRLVGGSYYYGRVEVYYQGRWGTICDDNFDHNDVKVICRMLGQYRGSYYGVAYQSARYGSGSGPITIDDLNCSGYESDITQCTSRPWNLHNCNHNEDASLNCHEYYYETSTYPARFTTPWWYRQTTSDTISIQSAILVTCDESGWDIRIDMYKLRLIYPDARASDIYLGENQCNGIESWNVLRFNQGLRECLTQEMNRNNQLVYSNELVYAEHDPYHSYIIRHYNWTVGVECDISSNMTSSGHIDHNNYHGSHQQVSGQSHFSVNMMFYTDPNYQYKLQYPLSVTVGQDVYVKVFTNATDWNVRMRVHTCYAKPSEYAADHLKYYLIRNGCEVDTNTHIISQSSHETRFVFQDFEYSQNQQGIHVFCDAKFCGAHDYSRDCMQACNPIIRRNVIYRPGDQELETAVPGDPVNVDSIYVESVAADDEDVTEDPIVVNDVSENDSTFYNAVVVDSSLEDEVNDNPVDSNETTDSE